MSEIVQTETPQGADNLHFVFWRHIPENADGLSATAAEADVVLLETSPLTPKPDKLVNEALLNGYLGAELTPRQQGILSRFGEGHDLHFDPDATQALLPGLFPAHVVSLINNYAGSGKVARYLDTNPKDHPDIAQQYHDIEAFRRETNAASDAGSLTWAQFLTRTTQSQEQMGRFLKQRDEVVAGQLHSQLATFAGKNILVVYGTNHSGLSHEFMRSGASREFLDAEPGVPKFVYSLESEAQRDVYYGRPMPDELLNRVAMKAVLQQYLMMQTEEQMTSDQMHAKMLGFDSGILDVSDMADDMARMASPEFVEEFVACFNADSVMTHDAQGQRRMQQLFDSLITAYRNLLDSGHDI